MNELKRVFEILKSMDPPARQSWLAKKLGVSPAYLTMINKGHRTLTDNMKSRIADVLRVPKEDLF